MVYYMPGHVDPAPTPAQDLTPREIAAELDRFIVGQGRAKRAVHMKPEAVLCADICNCCKIIKGSCIDRTRRGCHAEWQASASCPLRVRVTSEAMHNPRHPPGSNRRDGAAHRSCVNSCSHPSSSADHAWPHGDCSERAFSGSSRHVRDALKSRRTSPYRVSPVARSTKPESVGQMAYTRTNGSGRSR